jgi:hypothetical protein
MLSCILYLDVREHLFFRDAFLNHCLIYLVCRSMPVQPNGVRGSCLPLPMIYVVLHCTRHNVSASSRDQINRSMLTVVMCAVAGTVFPALTSTQACSTRVATLCRASSCSWRNEERRVDSSCDMANAVILISPPGSPGNYRGRRSRKLLE